jgi:small subunit ribosomal protein S12e
MSDSEHAEEVEQQEEEKEEMNKVNAARQVIKRAKFANGMLQGLNEVAKALDSKRAQLCFLSEDCEDAKYKKLITALCKQNNIPICDVEQRVDLGEWLGQCKYDK